MNGPREIPAFGKILAYLMVAVAAGALVAPPIFWAGQALEAAGVTDWLAKFPFHRVLSRCLQVSALILLVPALRWIGLRRPSDLHLQKNPLAVADLVVGLVLAVTLVAALAILCLGAGWLEWRADAAWSGLGRILLTAVAVSGVEEVVFRGVILGLCLWSLPRFGALMVTTVLFVVVHFIKPSKTEMAPDAVRWWSGLAETLRFTDGVPPGLLLLFGAASLFAAGWILGSAAVATRSLWLPIGLHAGWVFAQQTSNLFLRPVAQGSEGALPWIGPNLVSGAVPTGLLPLAALVLTGLLVKLYLRHVYRPVGPRNF
jgi:membrane protease YdiL (CAAX protease family)